MAKTRRTKINRSPQRAYPHATTHVADQGDKITTTGIRGRTKVKRVVNEEGKRVASVRLVEEAKQTPAKATGDRKPKGIFVGRVYTGVQRSKVYPVRSVKRGGTPPAAPEPIGLAELVAKAKSKFFKKTGAKQVVVPAEAAE
jgi:hypothetical protein